MHPSTNIIANSMLKNNNMDKVQNYFITKKGANMEYDKPKNIFDMKDSVLSLD